MTLLPGWGKGMGKKTLSLESSSFLFKKRSSTKKNTIVRFIFLIPFSSKTWHLKLTLYIYISSYCLTKGRGNAKWYLMYQGISILCSAPIPKGNTGDLDNQENFFTASFPECEKRSASFYFSPIRYQKSFNHAICWWWNLHRGLQKEDRWRKSPKFYSALEN